MNVIVYSTNNCPRCKLLKDLLLTLGIEYKEKDLGDTHIMGEFIMKNIYLTQAPILQVNNMVFEFRGEI